MHKSAKALGRALGLTPVLQYALELGQALIDYGLAQVILGFEVVIDITERHLSFTRYISQAGAVKTVAKRQLYSSLNQAYSFIGRHFRHFSAQAS